MNLTVSSRFGSADLRLCSNKHAELLGIEIGKRHRGKGHGAALAHLVIKRLRKLKAKTVGGAFVNPVALHIFSKYLDAPLRESVIDGWNGGFENGTAHEADFLIRT